MDKILDTALLMLGGSVITLEIFCATLALSLPLGLFVAVSHAESAARNLYLDHARYTAHAAIALCLFCPADGRHPPARYCRGTSRLCS